MRVRHSDPYLLKPLWLIPIPGTLMNSFATFKPRALVRYDILSKYIYLKSTGLLYRSGGPDICREICDASTAQPCAPTLAGVSKS